jgi:hypothetical protein
MGYLDCAECEGSGESENDWKNKGKSYK